MKHQNQLKSGFTLIELLVVIAIIALLASVVLLAVASAQQKGRDAKRLSDMTQMNTGLALYFNSNKGYPSSTGGLPSDLVPNFAASLPSAPQPPDGACASITYPSPVPAGTTGSQYYYYASGTAFLGSNGFNVYPDYAYFFCLGLPTGNFAAGMHILTPEGLQ